MKNVDVLVVVDTVGALASGDLQNNVYWEGTVETRGHHDCYQYTVTISIDGRQLSFDPFINVK